MKSLKLSQIKYKQFQCYNNVIFDFDGTLINSKGSIIDAVKLALEENGLLINEKNFEFGPPLDEALQKLCEGFETSIHKIKSSFINIYDKKTYNQITKIEGVDKLLRKLLKDKKKIYVVTNKRTDIAKKIWAEFFNEFKNVPVIGIDNYGHSVGNKVLLMRKFLLALKLDTNKSIYLGDTDNDFFVAKKNNISFIKLTY